MDREHLKRDSVGFNDDWQRIYRLVFKSFHYKEGDKATTITEEDLKRQRLIFCLRS